MELESLLGAVLGLEPDAVHANSTADDHPAWDSLNQLNVVAAIEEAYGVTLTMAEMREARSVPAIRAMLSSRSVAA